MISGGLCVAIGGFQGPGVGVKLGGMDDITDSARQWRSEKNPQNIGTGVFLDKHIYRANAGPGTIDCIEAETGDVVWTDRAAGGDHWGSVVYAGGYLFATNQDGTTTVFKPNPEKFEQVASNKLDEPTNATPAISDAQIFIRTFEHLYCIGE
jgi:outer membrane protein assembly factor BamB